MGLEFILNAKVANLFPLQYDYYTKSLKIVLKFGVCLRNNV